VIGLIGTRSGRPQSPALTHSTKGLLIVVGIQFVLFAVVFGVAWVASRATWQDLLCRWRGRFWIVPLSLLYSILLRLALGIVAIVVAVILIATGLVKPDEMRHIAMVNRPDVGAVVDVTALKHNPVYFWLTITLVSFVLAGFREELWRSAFLAGLKALRPRAFGSMLGQMGGIMVAAVVFGAGHLAQGPIAAFGAGLLGAGLGVIMVLHRSIWPAVIAHGAFDATTFGLLPLVMEKLQDLH
jgi:membrane protease YdiL (CAAX protease family)